MFIFSENIGVESGLKKYGVVILRKGKLVKFEGIHLTNHEIMKEVDENGYALPQHSRVGWDKRT